MADKAGDEINAECITFDPVTEEKDGILYNLCLAPLEKHRLTKDTSGDGKTGNTTLSEFLK